MAAKEKERRKDKAQREMFARLEQSMERVIVKTVNGKIDKVQKGLDDHITQHEADNKAAKEWRDKIEPVLENFNQWSGARKVLISISILVGSVAGLIIGGREVIEFLRKLKG